MTPLAQITLNQINVAKNKATQSKTINKPTISPKIRKVNKFNKTHNNTGKNSINPISTEKSTHYLTEITSHQKITK